MGTRIKRKVFSLSFSDDSDLAGATVKVRSISWGELEGLFAVAGSVGAALAEGATAETLIGALDPQDVTQMTAIFAKFGDALVEWDLEDEDGTPIPATREGLASLDADVALEIIDPWLEAVQGVRAGTPLPAGSGSGATSPEVSLPMEPLSRSRAS